MKIKDSGVWSTNSKRRAGPLEFSQSGLAASFGPLLAPCFFVTIALSGDSGYHNVRQTIDSGFDLLLLRPFSMTTLLDRIGHLVRQRAPFAITSDYIGPDRRLNARNPKPGDQKYQVIVPNPLKIRAEGKISPHKMRRLIKEGTLEVNETRIRRHGESIPDLVGSLVSNYMLDGHDDEFLPDRNSEN